MCIINTTWLNLNVILAKQLTPMTLDLHYHKSTQAYSQVLYNIDFTEYTISYKDYNTNLGNSDDDILICKYNYGSLNRIQFSVMLSKLAGSYNLV